MTDTVTDETVAEEITPFVDDQNREIAYRSDANPAAAAGADVRPAVVAPGSGTGRRKQAVARVRLRPGGGQITVNKRAVADYFPSETHRMIISEPLRVTNTAEVYDVDVTLHGGGTSGQAGALRMGIARALVDLDPELRPTLKKAGFLTRDPRKKESKKYGLKKARKAPQYSKR